MPYTTAPKQHTLWLLAALAAPAAQFSGCGWLTAAVTALVVLPLTLLPSCWDGMSKPLAVLQILWLGLTAGTLLKHSAACWPSDNDLVVPLTLLALAACTGAAAAPRIGAVLALCMALLALPVAVSGAARVEPMWLKPTWNPWPAGLALTLLLPALPAAGETQKGRGALYGAVVTLCLAALVQGVLSPGVAASQQDPFYQTARTLGHLEPVVAAGLSLGWYAMTAYLLHSAACVAKMSGMRAELASVLAVGTAAVFVIFSQKPNVQFVPVVSAVLWVLIPFLRKMNGFEKK